MANPLRVLIVDDSENGALLEMQELQQGGYEPTYQRVETLEAMKTALEEKTWDVVISDFNMPKFTGLAALKVLEEKGLDLPFIIVADTMSEDIALQSMKAGIHSFFKKKNIKLLVPAVERALREVTIKRESKQAEELFRSLAANSPAGVYIVQKGKFVYTNPQFQQSVGYREDELLGMESLNLVFPEDRKTVRDNAAQMLKGKRVVPYEYRAIDKNGKIKWVLESVASIQHQGKQATICSSHDITDRKKAEKELKASEERFRIAAQSTADLIWEWDIVNGTLEWFGAIDEKLGYSSGEFPRTIEAFVNSIHADDHDRVMAAIDRHLKAKEPYHEEFYVKRKDGTFGFWIAQGKAVRDAEGNPLKMIGACTDITDRKRAEAALKEKEERFKEVFENSGSGIAIYEAINNGEDFIYKKVNPAAARTVGMSLENYIGRRLFELYPEGKLMYDMLYKVWRTGVPLRQTLSHYKDETKDFWIEGHLNKLTTTGEVVHIFDDVTDQKHSEDNLKKAKEAAEAANIAKSNFLSRMSHEIRTPMNSIMGFIDMLLDTSLTEEQIDFAKTSKRSAQALLSLIDEILDFSKIEAGKMDLESIDFDPELLAYDVCEIIRPRVGEKRVEILCRIGDQVPSKVKGDPGRFRQILINLMGNAVKFTEAGQLELFFDIEEDQDDALKLHGFVRDTGLGIPKDKVELIFNPFQQADGSTTRKFGGTGLGLSITKQLINLMGGEIWVESEPDKGSFFHFTIWLKKSEDKLCRKPKPVSLEGKKVLLVDDTPLNLEILTHFLTSIGMRVIALTKAQEVVPTLQKAFATKDPFDIGVIDIQMPEMSGYDVANEVRKLDPPVSKTPLLAFSSSILQGAKMCFEAGFDGFLPKPLSRFKLLEIMERLVGEKEHQVPEHKREKIVTQYSLREELKHSVRIMLAEDNPVNQKLAAIMLTKAGYTVKVVNNGREAVEHYTASPDEFDLIFMDVQMPEMDGMEATKAIREKGFDRIPIIAMTAQAMVGDREKCLEVGMNDYLSKPIKREIVFEMVKNWVLKKEKDA